MFDAAIRLSVERSKRGFLDLWSPTPPIEQEKIDWLKKGKGFRRHFKGNLEFRLATIYPKAITDWSEGDNREGGTLDIELLERTPTTSRERRAWDQCVEEWWGACRISGCVVNIIFKGMEETRKTNDNACCY